MILMVFRQFKDNPVDSVNTVSVDSPGVQSDVRTEHREACIKRGIEMADTTMMDRSTKTAAKSARKRTPITGTKRPPTTDGVEVWVCRQGEKLDLELLVSETQEIHDERMAAAIREHLRADADYSDICDRAREMESNALDRCRRAEAAMQEMLDGMGGFTVAYRGLLYQSTAHWDAFPNYPVVVLRD